MLEFIKFATGEMQPLPGFHLRSGATGDRKGVLVRLKVTGLLSQSCPGFSCFGPLVELGFCYHGLAWFPETLTVSLILRL